MNYQDKTKEELIQELVLLKAENQLLSSSKKVSTHNTEDIRESKLRWYERFFEDNHSVMLLIDSHSGKVIDVNPAASIYYGWTRSEMQKMNISKINTLSPDDVKVEMQKAMTDKRRHFLFKHRLANGEVRDVEVYSGPISFGHTTYLYSIVHDVSERTKAIENLRISEEKYRNIFETVQDAYYEVSPDGILLDVSPSIKTISKGQYTREETIGKSFVDFYADPDARALFLKQLMSQGKVTDYELSLTNKDGSIVPVAISTTIIKDSVGNLLKITGSMRDISRRKKAEKEILKFKTIADQANYGVILSSLEGIFLYVNDAFAKMVGWEVDDLIGKHSSVVHNEDQAERVEEIISLMKSNKGFTSEELYHTRKDGSSFPTQMSSKVIFDENNVSQYLSATVIDISDRKLAEDKINKLNRLKTVISHINQAIITEKDKDSLLQKVCSVAIDYGNFRMAWIGLVEENTKQVKPYISAGFENGYLSHIKAISIDENAPESHGPTGSALRNGKPFVTNDIENDPTMVIWKDEAIKRNYNSSIALPLKQFGEIFGSLSLYSSQTNFFNEEETELLVEVVNNISYALTAIESELERKRAEEMMNQKSTILSNLLINLKEGVLLENADRKIELTNQMFCEMFGIPAPPDAMIGGDCSDSAEQSKYLFKNPEKFVVDIHRIVSAKKPVFNDELELLDGRYLERDFIPTYLEDIYSGHLWKYRDITERKLAEIELKKISQAVDQSPVMTIITGIEGKIQYANPALTKLTGYTKEELIGQKPNILSSHEKTQLDYQDLWKTITSGKQWKGEFHNKKKNGALYWASAVIAPMINSKGKITHYVSVEEDITHRKQMEKELIELNESLERKVEERTTQLNEANIKLENDIQKRILIEIDLRWNKSLLELMSNSSPLGFLVVDNRTDEILYFNHRFCRIWGIQQLEEQMNRGELKNNDIIPYCLPVLADIPAFAESCEPLQDENNRVVVEDEIPFINNQIVRRFSTQIRGENDEYFGRFYIFEDITERKQAEFALLESKEIFSSFMDYLPAVVFIKDQEGRTLFVNKFMDDAFGALQWVGKTMQEVFPGELGQKFLADDMNSFQMGYQRIEESLYQLDGQLHEYETQKFVINRTGREPLLGGIALDITVRKNAQALISQTQHNYETFFNTIDDFLFVLDEQWNIIHINDTVSERLQFNKEELNDKSVLMVHPPERREEAGRIVGEMLAGSADFCPVPLMTKTGSLIPVETKVKAGHWNGKPVIFGVSKDVSKIQLSEEKFSKAFRSNASSMAINGFDDGLFIDVNDTFVNTMGYSRDELIGKTSLELNLFDSEEARDAIYIDLKNNIKVKEKEIKVITKSGRKITGLFSAEQIYIGDELCMLTLFVDISERIKVEEESRIARMEAEKANLAKSEFLSRMSHELRTPMNSILGFAQLLEMGDLNLNQKKGVNHIMKSGKHLLNLINEVLDISRIEAGRLDISIEPIQIDTIILEMMDILTPFAERHQIKLQLAPSDVNKSFVNADLQSFRQVLLNLINNAIKFNKQGGDVTVKAEIKAENKNDKSTIRISISDTGRGLRQEDISKLFIPFERITALNTQIEGTGLGLAVVKKLTENMGGSYGVESVLDEGSTFWIELQKSNNQLDKDDKSKTLSDEELDASEKIGTVLYIEDNQENIDLITDILESYRANIKLHTSYFGSETVRLAKKHRPDLILLDVNLPDMNGAEVLYSLQCDYRTKGIPVIILSADAMENQIQKLLKAGAYDYITKPIDIKSFLETVDKFIQKK
ncbi:MAG: PAS domain S-box protein [Bacteroidales bacterium]